MISYSPGDTVKLPVWSDEWMFGVTTAKVTSIHSTTGEPWVYVKIPGRSKRSAFRLRDLQEKPHLCA